MLRYLELKNFRNFTNFRTPELGPGLNLIIEPNGVGKSNFLEGVYLLATGSSPRTKKTKQLIQWGQELAYLKGQVETNDLAITVESGQKIFWFNGKKVGLDNFLSHLKVVFFQPMDLNLLDGSPSNRRAFLNRLCVQFDFQYLTALLEFSKVLKQRNATLKRGGVQQEDLLSILDEQLSRVAEVLFIKRNEVIDQINRVFLDQGLRIEYLPYPKSVREMCEKNAGNIAVFVREKLRELRGKEKSLGFTLIGPQRDDFILETQDQVNPDGWKDLGAYGSRGQQRMAIVRLKLAEWQVLAQEDSGVSPLVLLDDVFSELDEENKNLLFELLPKAQSIITLTNPALIPADLPNNFRINLP